jgi:Integrase core domain
VRLEFIPPEDQLINGYVESFNGRLRAECLNAEPFFDLTDLMAKLERWRQDYNQVRPNSAFRSFSLRSSPAQQSSARSLRMAGPTKQLPAGAVQRNDAADPRLLQLFVPPSKVRGGPEKLPREQRGAGGRKEGLARGCRWSLLSAINAVAAPQLTLVYE